MTTLEPIIWHATMRNDRAKFLRALLHDDSIGARPLGSTARARLPREAIVKKGELI
jgi:hypothetical protein